MCVLVPTLLQSGSRVQLPGRARDVGSDCADCARIRMSPNEASKQMQTRSGKIGGKIGGKVKEKVTAKIADKVAEMFD